MTLNLFNLFRRNLFNLCCQRKSKCLIGAGHGSKNDCISLSYKWMLFYFSLTEQQRLICEMTEKLLKWNKSQAEYGYVARARYSLVHVSILPDSTLNPECISLLCSQAAISSGKSSADVTLAHLWKKTTIYGFSEDYITVSPAHRKFQLQVEPVPHLFGWHISSPRCAKTSS